MIGQIYMKLVIQSRRCAIKRIFRINIGALFTLTYYGLHLVVRSNGKDF